MDSIDINLNGAWRTARSLVPAMRSTANGGSIVITSSTTGLKGSPDYAAYSASKHALVGLMRSLAIDLGRYSIRVNTIHPTSVNTPMVNNETHIASISRSTAVPPAQTIENFNRSRHLLPVGWLDAIDIANAVLWLLSDEARYVTGVTLPVDAGLITK